MPEIIEEAVLINQFLCDIKKKLPIWIRLKKSEVRDILNELEEHIWEKAIENAGENVPNEIDVQIAISYMGTPEEIACKYFSKSTPHVYMSEEFYPIYKKYRNILFKAYSISLVCLFFPYLMGMFNIFYMYEINLLTYVLYTSIFFYLVFLILYLVFFYLSTKGYPLQEKYDKKNRITQNLARTKYRTVKKPISIINLLSWACIWAITGILISFFHDISFKVGPIRTIHLFQHPYMLILFISLSIINLLRSFIMERSIILQKVFIGMSIVLIALIFTEQMVIISLFNETIADLLLIIFLIIVMLRTHAFFTLREKFNKYFRNLGLYKRVNKRNEIFETMMNLEKINGSSRNEILLIRNNRNISYFETDLNKFMKKLRKKLPFWYSKSKKNEIDLEIREMIDEIALDYEFDENRKDLSFQKIIDKIGSTEKILSEYKQPGTPQIFISKEMWPRYITLTTVLLIYLLTIALIQVILDVNVYRHLILYIIFTDFFIYVFLYILLIFPLTQLFILLSMSGFSSNPNGKLDFIKQIADSFFIVLYFVSADIIFLMVLGRGDFSDSPDKMVILLLFSSLLTLLGLGKLSGMVLKKKYYNLKRILIIFNLVLSLALIIIAFYNIDPEHSILMYFDSYLVDYVVIKFDLFLWFVTAAVPINIELFRSMFQLLLFKKQRLFI